jgi:hypothetical protein
MYEKFASTKVRFEIPWKKFSNLGIFYVDDESLVDVKLPQVICYVFWYKKSIGHVVLK